MSKYLVQQIGCIECGVSTYPIKVVASLDEAYETANSHPSTWDSEDGDGYVSIVDLESLVIVDEVEPERVGR